MTREVEQTMQIAVCDDEKNVRELLADKIRSLFPSAELALYPSGEELLAADTPTDILLLDIQMPGKDGMQTAREFRAKNRQAAIIFVTALEEYVFQAFDVEAFHYLVKPFDDDKFASVLQTAVNRRLEKSVNATASLVITKGGEHITVNPQEIIYAEVFDRKIILHTLQDEIEYYGKMKELEKKVGEDFYRPHRAYLVNMNYIRKIRCHSNLSVKGTGAHGKTELSGFRQMLSALYPQERNGRRCTMNCSGQSCPIWRQLLRWQLRDFFMPGLQSRFCKIRGGYTALAQYILGSCLYFIFLQFVWIIT